MPKALHNVGLAITSISVAALEWNCELLLPFEKPFHTMHRILRMDLWKTYRNGLGEDMGV